MQDKNYFGVNSSDDAGPLDKNICGNTINDIINAARKNACTNFDDLSTVTGWTRQRLSKTAKKLGIFSIIKQLFKNNRVSQKSI